MTGIDKAPVTGRVTLRTLNLDGDGQADPHFGGGGPTKLPRHTPIRRH
jgi:MOSC domain-containing protein YiiM